MSSKKFLNFSPVFYGKEGTIAGVIERTQTALAGVQNHYQNLKSSTKDLIIKFCKASISEQRKILEIEGMNVIETFVEVIEKVGHDKNLMLYLLPTLDGILFGIFNF